MTDFVSQQKDRMAELDSQIPVTQELIEYMDCLNSILIETILALDVALKRQQPQAPAEIAQPRATHS
jgi:hypothetical protein